MLTHPNTVTVFDYGRTTDGIFYYAMELLEGASLDEIVDVDGPQPEERVIHLLEQAAASLAEAHDAGLIHRDVKPGNILVVDRGGISDLVKVVDFGLVKDVGFKEGEGATSDIALTVANTITGTPLYLAPEAIIAPETVDARADLYALGAVGYWLFDRHARVQRHVDRRGVCPSFALRARAAFRSTACARDRRSRGDIAGLSGEASGRSPCLGARTARTITCVRGRAQLDQRSRCSLVGGQAPQAAFGRRRASRGGQRWRRPFSSPDGDAHYGLKPRTSSALAARFSERFLAQGPQREEAATRGEQRIVVEEGERLLVGDVFGAAEHVAECGAGARRGGGAQQLELNVDLRTLGQHAVAFGWARRVGKLRGTEAGESLAALQIENLDGTAAFREPVADRVLAVRGGEQTRVRADGDGDRVSGGAERLQSRVGANRPRLRPGLAGPHEGRRPAR